MKPVFQGRRVGILNSLNFTKHRTHKDLQSTAIVAYSILKRLTQVPKGAKKIALPSAVPLVLQLCGVGRGLRGGQSWQGDTDIAQVFEKQA